MSETPWREASHAADFDALQIAADDDRVRALDALRESEERYRELFENANDMVYTQDLSGRITSVNRATERLSGYSRAELLTLTIDQLVESSSRPVMRAMLDRKLSGEERTIYEVEMRAKDGRSVPLEVSARLILRDGIPAGVQGIARDITERKRAEELLRQSEERFRLLVENSSDGIYLVAADGLVVYASRPVTRILGYGIDELVGRHFLDLLHPDDRDPASWFFADILSKPGLAINSSYRCLHKDGAFRNLEAVGVNRLDESGVAAIILNFRDVTERKRAEQALLESEERFRAVFESALVGIARLDLSGRIVDTNRAMQEMFGYLLDELRGRPLRDFVHPEEADARRARFQGSRRGDHRSLPRGTADHPEGQSSRLGQPDRLARARRQHAPALLPGDARKHHRAEARRIGVAGHESPARRLGLRARTAQARDLAAQRDGRHAPRLPQPRGSLRGDRTDGEPALSARIGIGQRADAGHDARRNRRAVGRRRSGIGCFRSTTAGRCGAGGRTWSSRDARGWSASTSANPTPRPTSACR